MSIIKLIQKGWRDIYISEIALDDWVWFNMICEIEVWKTRLVLEVSWYRSQKHFKKEAMELEEQRSALLLMHLFFR